MAYSQLPPEDQPDSIDIGPVTGIPIIEDDDPRFEEERKAWSIARRDAQGRHSAEELLDGLGSDNWQIRYEVIDRLVARARQDGRTLPALTHAASHDASWQVRDKAVQRLDEFDDKSAVSTLMSALNDPHPDVRASARFGLAQVGQLPDATTESP